MISVLHCFYLKKNSIIIPNIILFKAIIAIETDFDLGTFTPDSIISDFNLPIFGIHRTHHNTKDDIIEIYLALSLARIFSP